MQKVTVKRLTDSTFEVDVQGARNTRHTVTVPPEYAHKLTGGTVAVDHLVRRSFDFLLEREPNTSILRSFELPLIAHYFPEYERLIGAMLK